MTNHKLVDSVDDNRLCSTDVGRNSWGRQYFRDCPPLPEGVKAVRLRPQTAAKKKE